jgi:hypothetical protein
MIPNEIWMQGPAVVNAEIRRLMAEHGQGAQDVDDTNPDFAPILAIRAALRVLPLLATDRGRLGDAAKSKFVLLVFRALAAAWAKTRYSALVDSEWSVAAARDVSTYGPGSGPAALLVGDAAAQSAFAAGSVNPEVVDARASRAFFQVREATRASGRDRVSDVIVELAYSQDQHDIIPGVRPDQLAHIELWPGRDPPPFIGEQWARLKEGLTSANEGWDVWIEWYEARLDGRLRSQRVELAYVQFIRNVSPTASAWEANSEIRRLIDEATKAPEPTQVLWDFFVSYATEDEAIAREVVGVLESAGHSTIAQFKDFSVGANFVHEMNRGLARAGRVVAIYSPNYQASPHCQAEWAAAYAADPSGAKRKLVPFLLAPTALDPLARQVVYKTLVGLTEIQRKAAVLEAIAPRPPSRNEIKGILAEVASPQASINAKKQLDAGPNATFDRPFVDADLPELPSIQRGLANAIRKSLPRNAPPVVGVVLENYSEHLLERGAQPIVRYLDDLTAALRAEHEAPEAVDWGKGLAALFQRFFANDALLRTHFPLKGEEVFAELPIDEDKATGHALSDPIKNVASAMDEVVAVDKATPAIAKAVSNSAAFARDLASLPPAASSPDPKSTRVSVKRRYVLGTIGFLVTIYNLIGTTASIYGIPEGAALLKAVTEAIEKFMSLLL